MTRKTEPYESTLIEGGCYRLWMTRRQSKGVRRFRAWWTGTTWRNSRGVDLKNSGWEVIGYDLLPL